MRIKVEQRSTFSRYALKQEQITAERRHHNYWVMDQQQRAIKESGEVPTGGSTNKLFRGIRLVEEHAPPADGPDTFVKMGEVLLLRAMLASAWNDAQRLRAQKRLPRESKYAHTLAEVEALWEWTTSESHDSPYTSLRALCDVLGTLTACTMPYERIRDGLMGEIGGLRHKARSARTPKIVPVGPRIAALEERVEAA